MFPRVIVCRIGSVDVCVCTVGVCVCTDLEQIAELNVKMCEIGVSDRNDY
jgi:hypothetical protein